MHLTEDIIIDINNRSECCICIESKSIEYHDTTTICCKQSIHVYCMFMTFVSGHEHCPLCRSDMKIKDYISDKEFKSFLNKMTRYDYSKYKKEIKKLRSMYPGYGSKLWTVTKYKPVRYILLVVALFWIVYLVTKK